MSGFMYFVIYVFPSFVKRRYLFRLVVRSLCVSCLFIVFVSYFVRSLFIYLFRGLVISLFISSVLPSLFISFVSSLCV